MTWHAVSHVSLSLCVRLHPENFKSKREGVECVLETLIQWDLDAWATVGDFAIGRTEKKVVVCNCHFSATAIGCSVKFLKEAQCIRNKQYATALSWCARNVTGFG